MGNITAAAIVRCPLDQAGRTSAHFFAQQPLSDDGHGARIELSAQPESRSGAPQAAFAAPAIATISARRVNAQTATSYAVCWRQGTQTAPTFPGDLWFAPHDDDERFELLLDGRYEMPLGSDDGCAAAGPADRYANLLAQLIHTIAQTIESAATHERLVPTR